MRQCAQNLSLQEYDLLQKYVQSKKPVRKELAEQHGISIRNLRLRVYHIRERLKECRAACVKQYLESLK